MIAKKTFFIVTVLISHHLFASQPYYRNITEQERTDFSNLPIKDMVQKYPAIKIIEIQPDNQRYGICHNYAISKLLDLKGKISSTFPICGNDDWHTKINFLQRYCQEVSQPTKGGLVIYYDSLNPSYILHTGLVHDENTVESKWGIREEIFLHPTRYVPKNYGDKTKCYVLKIDKNLIIDDLRKHTSHYIYQQDCIIANKALISRAEEGNSEEVWSIWQRNMCTSIEFSNCQRQSLIMIAAKTGNIVLVKLFLKKANLKKQDVNGNTALDLARKNKHKAIVKLLKKEKKRRYPKPTFRYNKF